MWSVKTKALTSGSLNLLLSHFHKFFVKTWGTLTARIFFFPADQFPPNIWARVWHFDWQVVNLGQYFYSCLPWLTILFSSWRTSGWSRISAEFIRTSWNRTSNELSAVSWRRCLVRRRCRRRRPQRRHPSVTFITRSTTIPSDASTKDSSTNSPTSSKAGSTGEIASLPAPTRHS